MEGEVKSYYEENIEILIEKLETSLNHLYPIIEGSIDADIKDDKLFNVLKGKRQAAEDVEWTLKKIKQLENERDGVQETQQANGEPVNHAKRRAEQKRLEAQQTA